MVHTKYALSKIILQIWEDAYNKKLILTVSQAVQCSVQKHFRIRDLKRTLCFEH